jgi:hypothetical protein
MTFAEKSVAVPIHRPLDVDSGHLPLRDSADALLNFALALSRIPGRLPGALHHLAEADHVRTGPEWEREIVCLRTERK